MSGESLYVLVEGDPASPELPFLQNSIIKIFKDSNIPYVPEVFEIGGSSFLFNSNLAKTFYKRSKAHIKIPVLAIADWDYRVESDKSSENNDEIIKFNKAKVLYWPRHEWENYLLEETGLIADFVNQFPVKPKKTGGFSKESNIKITKEDLDSHLMNYFIASIKEEFFECLKFNLSPKTDRYPSFSKPNTFDTDTIEQIKQWFLSTAEERKITIKPIRNNLYQEITNEYRWNEWTVSPEILPFDFAKIHFRGKESLTSLIDFIGSKIDCNIDKGQFQRDILERLNDNSQIVLDLRALLLKELS